MKCIMTSRPCDLRRNIKAVVLVGMVSNPTDVIFALPHPIQMSEESFTNLLYSIPTSIHVSQNTNLVDIPNDTICAFLAISAPHLRKYYLFCHNICVI